MKASCSRIPESKLDQTLADIRIHLTDTKTWQSAMKSLSSVRDYSFSDARACSAQEAIGLCQEIKGLLPDTAPPEVAANLDSITEEIRRIEKEEFPLLSETGVPHPAIAPLVAILILAAVYWFFFR